jgi:hypothetical protein
LGLGAGRARQGCITEMLLYAGLQVVIAYKWESSAHFGTVLSVLKQLTSGVLL